MTPAWSCEQRHDDQCAHSNCRKQLLTACPMQRLTILFGALMLAVFVWTASTAHAAERLDCVTVSVEAVGHFDGDGDEAPDSDEKGVAHHHSGCSGHHSATPADQPSPVWANRQAALRRDWNTRGSTDREPDEQLRPPIA